jgi:hypothetical protein
MERSDQNPVNESELDIEDLESVSGGRWSVRVNFFNFFTVSYDSGPSGSSSGASHADHARA